VNARTRQVRQITSRAILVARQTSREIGYLTLSGIIGALLRNGRLIRTGDFLDRVGGSDLKDGFQSWYGRHVKKAYKAATGSEPVMVWARHRRTGRWLHVAAYAPSDPALTEGLRSYKQTQHLALQAAFTQAA
jgi:hypothetical protein